MSLTGKRKKETDFKMFQNCSKILKNLKFWKGNAALCLHPDGR